MTAHLQPCERRRSDTIMPVDTGALAPTAAHAASEIHDDEDDGTGDGVLMGRMLLYALFVVLCAALWVAAA